LQEQASPGNGKRTVRPLICNADAYLYGPIPIQDDSAWFHVVGVSGAAERSHQRAIRPVSVRAIRQAMAAQL